MGMSLVSVSIILFYIIDQSAGTNLTNSWMTMENRLEMHYKHFDHRDCRFILVVSSGGMAANCYFSCYLHFSFIGFVDYFIGTA